MKQVLKESPSLKLAISLIQVAEFLVMLDHHMLAIDETPITCKTL